VPRYARPANSERAEDPIEAFGNRLRTGIIGYLKGHPAQSRAEIAAALDVPSPTVFNALEKLLDAGLLIADPPRSEWERGQRVRYSVNGELVSVLYLQLGQALGEI
jgi:DNA-binding transcriptional ArsR family regulator